MDGGTDCDCDCEADDLMLAAGVSRSASGRVWRRLSARRALGAVYGSVAEALDATSADVVVDYTSARRRQKNVRTAVRAGRMWWSDQAG
ncbi:hypothetical protein [Actinomadura madurae]|uniref:hypothetical protein n=1 Tax=Actinomadura madurae TaxID=1993 RepID=UPI0020D1FAC9|nr:hypothetical protein [Actinomadura madurae]MCP9981435.1 hypothetical protein [Actinomadura madurae]